MQEAGRDPDTLQVEGVLPVVRVDGEVDVDATMTAVPPLVEAGVTDFRFHHRWGRDPNADSELLTTIGRGLPHCDRTAGGVTTLSKDY